MLLSTHVSGLHSLLKTSNIDGFSHFATSSLNSVEYLTALVLGLAHESCTKAAREGEMVLAARSPLEVTAFLSISPIQFLSDFSERCLQLQEATQNYFEYVDTDFQIMH